MHQRDPRSEPPRKSADMSCCTNSTLRKIHREENVSECHVRIPPSTDSHERPCTRCATCHSHSHSHNGTTRACMFTGGNRNGNQPEHIRCDVGGDGDRGTAVSPIQTGS